MFVWNIGLKRKKICKLDDQTTLVSSLGFNFPVDFNFVVNKDAKLFKVAPLSGP